MNNKKYIIISVIVGIVFLAMGVLIGLVYSNRDVIFKENNISNENNMPKNDLENDNINKLINNRFCFHQALLLPLQAAWFRCPIQKYGRSLLAG